MEFLLPKKSKAFMCPAPVWLVWLRILGVSHAVSSRCPYSLGLVRLQVTENPKFLSCKRNIDPESPGLMGLATKGSGAQADSSLPSWPQHVAFSPWLRLAAWDPTNLPVFASYHVEEEKATPPSFEDTCRQLHVSLPLKFYRQNLVIWSHISVRKAGKLCYSRHLMQS